MVNVLYLSIPLRHVSHSSPLKAAHKKYTFKDLKDILR